MDKNLKFINKAKLIHGDKYFYQKVNYINAHKKVTITCEKHGDFEITPNNHLYNRGCKLCGYENSSVKQRNTKNVFINKAKLIHGDKFSYENVDYINSGKKIIITCNEHGDFEMSPDNHLAGQGCSICGGTNKKNNTKIIEEFTKIHKNKYDYSIVDYVNSKSKVIIICPIHGNFEQTPDSHINGSGCPKCSGKNKTTSDLIKSFINIHGEHKYTYNKVKFKNNKTKVIVTCPKHGDFKTLPSNHLQGKGCPICRESKGERIIREYLIKNNINFIPQYKFAKCKNIKILPFDFYLLDYNVCIEFNGIQHYKPIKLFGGDENLKTIQKRDIIKMEYCKNNNIPLIIIKYTDDITNTLILLLKKYIT
jgi:hypothetical protein